MIDEKRTIWFAFFFYQKYFEKMCCKLKKDLLVYLLVNQSKIEF